MSTFQSFLDRLRAEWPAHPIVVRPYHRPEDPSITGFAYVLDVPVDLLSKISRRAWRLAFEIYGDEPIPFHLSTVDPKASAIHFASESSSSTSPGPARSSDRHEGGEREEHAGPAG
jgi:hypothetical protein